MKILDYIDERGVKRRVKLPDDENDASMGIPIDVYDLFDAFLYENSPLSFRIKFYEALWARGIIQSQDLNKRDAVNLIMGAYRAAIKFEANSAIVEFQRLLNND